MAQYQYSQDTAEACRNADGVDIDPPARLTYQFLLNNKLPVWVLTAIPPQSLLTFTIKQGGGMPGQALRIPRSKYPFNVTQDTPPDILRNGGKDVWGAIDKGMLVLVWPSDAEKMNESRPNNEGERNKISKWSTQQATKSKELMENEKILRQAKVAQENAEAEQAAEQQDPVNARVMDIVSRVQAGEVKLDKATEEFDDLSEAMTERDYQYAIANVKGGKLREWLQAQLAKGVVAPAKKPKKAKPAAAAAADDGDESPVPKKPKAAAGKKTHDVFDDSEPEMTDEEREEEAAAEAAARQRQRPYG